MLALAADVAGDHPDVDLVAREDGAGQHLAGDERMLDRRMQSVAPGIGVVMPDAAPRLHGVGQHARDHQPLADHVGGAGEGGIGRRAVADPVDEAFVVRALVPDRWRFGAKRVDPLDHGGKRPVVDHDQLGGVLGGGERLSDDERHRIADEAGAVSYRRERRDKGRRSAPPLDRRADQRHVAEPVGGVIGPCQHHEHAGRR